jgi:uncharacterized protein (TIGR02453 family)
MSTTSFSKTTLKFLKELQANNNRDWFAEHKPRYQEAQEEMKAFAETLLNKMSHHDEIENIRPYRIYRDVRFSKDKLPYKNNLGCGMKRATKWKRGGYYFNIEPGNNFVAGGFWGPNPEDLKRIRQEIAGDHKPLQKICNAASFKKVFGTLEGEQVKTAPKGFPKDHKAIEFLRYKQFILRHQFTDQQVTTEGFVNELSKAFKAMRPFLNYMSEVLTTDENGTPI